MVGGIYVTYVADADNRQQHVVTLVWSFKKTFNFSVYLYVHQYQ